MSTRTSVRNLFPPLDNPKLTIQRRSRTDPTLLNNSEMAAEGNGDLQVPDLRTIEELCQPSLNGRGDPIAIQETNIGLKNDMIQQVQNSYQFHGLSGDDANKHLDKFLHQMDKMFLGKYFLPSLVTKLRNEITNFCQRPDESLFEAWEYYKLSIDRFPIHNMSPVTQIDTFYKRLTLRHRDTINSAAGGTFMKRPLKAEMAEINKNLMRVLQQLLATLKTHMLREPIKANDAILKNMQTNMTSLTNSNLELKNMFGHFIKMTTASSSGSGTLPGNTITNPKEDLKDITTRSGTPYKGPTIPTASSSLPPVVERKTEIDSPILNSDLIINPIIEPVASPVSALKPNQRPSIPYPSRLQDQKLRDKANDQREKFFKIFKDLNFNISFADALILMPKFGPSIKSWLTNKDKLCEIARTPLNEHYSAVLLKKLPEKLGDPGKFLISCDFSEMAECLALADLGASINLMPLSVWNKLYLPNLSPTCMTLELVDRSISRPVKVAEDVFVKVGTFHFSTDFVVVDFDADPRVPLILRRSFLKTGRALIDVFEVLGFSDVIASGNPTSYYDPIVSTTSPTLTPFENSDFLLEEVDAFLALEDDPTSPEVDQSYVELKDLPPHLEYVFLKGDDKLPVIIPKDLSVEEKTALITEDFEPAVQHHRRVNPKIHDVIKNEVLKLLDAGLIYPISDSPWFKEANHKDHFPLPFMDQMLERLAGNEYYCFLDGFSGYFQIPIDPKDQEITTFTCPYETFAYRRMTFGLCNAPGTFQRCMMAIFHDMIEKTMEVFMDDFSVLGILFKPVSPI
nr:reverse transcriptase domain-containing protein [Tanacetum cinerariifolium]